MDSVTLFAKSLNQRSLTPRWPLTPHLLRSRVWLYPRIIVFKSHGNTSIYVDTVINFPNYHIHTTYYILRTTWRMSDHMSLSELSSGETKSNALIIVTQPPDSTLVNETDALTCVVNGWMSGKFIFNYVNKCQRSKFFKLILNDGPLMTFGTNSVTHFTQYCIAKMWIKCLFAGIVLCLYHWLVNKM